MVPGKARNSVEMYHLACAAGVLERLYHPSHINPVPLADPFAQGLNNALTNWKGLPVIKEWEAAASVSLLGGQGIKDFCSCRGKCANNQCSCIKANRRCGSKCHGGINKNCLNHD